MSKVRVASIAAVALMAGGVGAAGPAQADTPVVGSCLNYTEDQWRQTAFSATAVDCTLPHNGEVLGTVGLPDDIIATGYGSSSAKGWAYRTCQSVAVEYVWTATSTKYPKSSYVLPRSARLYVQLPSAEQWAAGERWAACVGQSRNVALTAPSVRTGSVRALGLKPYVCLNPRNWNGTRCGRTDAVRLTSQVWIPSSYAAAYPGTNRMLAKTRRACVKLRKRGWTLRTWYVPGLTSWERGNRYGYCEIVK